MGLPITIEPVSGTIEIRGDGGMIASSSRALMLNEAGYEPVVYVPRSDVAMDLLQRLGQQTHCPFKGDASYFALADHNDPVAWSYEEPKVDVAEIAGYLAFYRDRVRIVAL